MIENIINFIFDKMLMESIIINHESNGTKYSAHVTMQRKNIMASLEMHMFTNK